MAQPKQQNAKGLDYPPYKIESIISGEFDDSIEFLGNPKAKELLLPFQDESTWKLLNETLNAPQPKTSVFAPVEDPEPNNDGLGKLTLHGPPRKFPEELEYLMTLFQTLGGHKANKFCEWLHDIRSRPRGTFGVAASMDISKIGAQCALSDTENAEEIYQTFFNETLPFLKRLILSMPRIFGAHSAENGNEQKNNNEPDDAEGPENDDDGKAVDGDDDGGSGSGGDAVKTAFLGPDSNGQLSLSRGQIASILACCWFGVGLYPHCSFSTELSVVGTPAKMEMWVRYFDFVRQKGMDSDWFNNEKVTVWRRCLTAEQCAGLEHEKLVANDAVLCDFEVFENGAIEDQPGQLHADFANQFIGGGVLEGGNVQEEIRFTVNTECLVSKWLCPFPMRINEAILIFGSQQLFNYSGYGSRFKFAGYRHEENEMFFCRNKPERLGSSVIVGIDAVHFMNPQQQIRVGYLMRECLKSYVGFSVENEQIGHGMDTVSTGNWGCGIFRGDPQLKAMLQWISVTLSGRKVAYYTFSDRRMANGIIKDFIAGIAPKKVTVGALWRELSSPQFAAEYRKGATVVDLLNAKFVN